MWRPTELPRVLISINYLFPIPEPPFSIFSLLMPLHILSLTLPKPRLSFYPVVRPVPRSRVVKLHVFHRLRVALGSILLSAHVLEEAF
jgi:hypothetical protein